MHFYFIGVTTKQSAIARILPLWSEVFGTELDLIGIDLPIAADPSEYRRVVRTLKNDLKAIGSVVTTHKLNLFRHAADLFDEFDTLSELTQEICLIAKQDHHLVGLAIPDCLSANNSLKNMIGTNYWQTHNSDVLCFGAGGVARSIALCLLFDLDFNSPLERRQLSIPRKLLLVDNDQEQLKSISKLLEPVRENLEISYFFHTNPADNDQLLANLPAGSLIVNATGMGKDRPGSPITDQAIFPSESVVWDLNYRGERNFLQQAEFQKSQLKLNVHDGWLCFLHGWTQALQIALRQTLSEKQFQQLEKIAEPFRPISIKSRKRNNLGASR
jgi:shikimate dehydrogenase